MHRIVNAAPRRFAPDVSAAQPNRTRRLLSNGMARFGRAIASSVIAVSKGLLKGLQESRCRMAARIIDEHRHLLGDVRPLAAPPCANDSHPQRPRTDRKESDASLRRLDCFLAALMIVFAFAHVIGLQELHANRGERSATVDLVTD
jgi:hypothetical protein